MLNIFSNRKQVAPPVPTTEEQGYIVLTFEIGTAFARYFDGEITEEEVLVKIRRDAEEFVECEGTE
jgi:hypothetical protein